MIRCGDMKVTSLPLTGGVDELSPSNKVALERCIEMENFRLSKDGSRIQKRLGLTEEVTNFSVDVFGYTTYYNLAGTFCELAVLETGISRFVTGGAWASIHTWSSSIAHPVIPIEAQGKMFVITEVDSRMIHHDSADYQIGIAKPTGTGAETLPVCSLTYSAVETPPLNDTMSGYADQAAMDAVWTDSDSGTGGASTLDETDPDSTQGPDADSHYMRFYVPTLSPDVYARRSLSTGTHIGAQWTLETALYFDSLGHLSDSAFFEISVWTGIHRVNFRWSRSGCWLYGLDGYHRRVTTATILNRWDRWKFFVDGSLGGNIEVDAYLNDVHQGHYTYFNPTTDTPSLVQITMQSGSISQVATMDCHMDSIKIYNKTDAAKVLEGEYRYAVTYYRGGNFPAESNPIKSYIGSVSFTGTGVNDMTISATSDYTGTSTKVFRILVYAQGGVGVADTIQWSEDNGLTYTAKLNCSTTVYIGYGITLSFATYIHSHTANDYWTFTAYVCAGMPTIQEVTLTALPVSSDPQVTARRIYRTTRNGTTFYYLATINDNVTTTMTDNMPDSILGAEMEEDHDRFTSGESAGKFSAWWEDRLWVSGDDIIYYSQARYPEHFDISARYITVTRGNPNDEITGLKPYKDSLYVFTKKAIYAIQKTTSGYGIYLVCQDVGCRASWSIIEVNSLLMFISDRGIEIFNGVDVYPVCPSDIIERTVGTIDPANYKYITAVHHKPYYEVWFSVPDRTSGSAITIVYHYPTNSFYFFSFYKVPSCLASVYNSSGKRVTKIGTRDGYLCLTESTYRDNTTAITATYRKGWISTVAYEDIRRLEVEYELPATMTLTSNIYVNFDKDVARTDSHTGVTPSATDIELRRPIFDFSELGQHAKYFSVEFTNAENLGGDLKINDIKIYHKDRAHKGAISAD